MNSEDTRNLFLAIALAVVVAVAFLAIGRLGDLPEADVDITEPYLPEGPVTPDGLAGTRFAVGLRGYRMSQVDDVLDRVIRDLADRDLRIAELESELAAQGAEEPVGALPPDVRAHDGSTPSGLTSSPPWALPTGSTETEDSQQAQGTEQPGGAGSEGESVKLAAEHSGPAPAGGTEGDNEHSGPAPAGGTEGDNEHSGPAPAGGTEGDAEHSGPAPAGGTEGDNDPAADRSTSN
jgi:DivIVA domain-containing protein